MNAIRIHYIVLNLFKYYYSKNIKKKLFFKINKYGALKDK